MGNKSFDLTTGYQKVKSSGVISSMRVVGGIARLVNSSTAPGDTDTSFPIYQTDGVLTFASNVEIYAKGTGTLAIIEVEPE